MSAFSRGFASVLDVYGSPVKDELSLEYNGKDLASTSTEEALSADWQSIVGIEFEVDEDDERS